MMNHNLKHGFFDKHNILSDIQKTVIINDDKMLLFPIVSKCNLTLCYKIIIKRYYRHIKRLIFNILGANELKKKIKLRIILTFKYKNDYYNTNSCVISFVILK